MTRPALAPPEIIFFDAVGTLFHLPRGVGEHYREVALRHGIDLPAEAWQRAFGAAWKAAEPPITTRKRRLDDDKGWWRALVGRVLDQCSLAERSANDALFEELYLEFTKPGIWALYPEVISVLEKLHLRFRLGIISNFDGRLRTVLRHLVIISRFELVVISSEVGADKPDAWIYEEAARLAGVPLGRCWHIGDDPLCDWKGAREAGMISWPLDRQTGSLLDVLTAAGLEVVGPG